jgi:hypothetical protein
MIGWAQRYATQSRPLAFTDPSANNAFIK